MTPRISWSAWHACNASCTGGHRFPPRGPHGSLPGLPPGAQGSLTCHTGPYLKTVVVRTGRAVAFIDFDLATPANPLFVERHRPSARVTAETGGVSHDPVVAQRFGYSTGSADKGLETDKAD